MSSSLKQSTVEKFEEVNLSDGQLAALRELIENVGTIEVAEPKRNWSRRYLAIAAAAIVILLLPLANQIQRSYRAETLITAIAMEVAENHLKLKPLEIQSSDLREVLGYFDGLEFNLVESSSIAANPGDQLLGGRYCSIQGVDAAQLRVRSKSGQLSTWYEATLPASSLNLIPNIDHGDSPETRYLKGLLVRVWQENGVLFSEAKE